MPNQFPIRIALALLAAVMPSGLVLAQSNASDRASANVDSKQEAGREEPASQKYRDVFFPHGMPIEQDPGSAEQKQSVYAFYDEAKIGDSFLAVLYSKKIPSPEGDANYTVYLGLLARSGGGWSVSQTTELTEWMPVETEFPGNFYRMDGRLNSFMVTSSVPGLHVNLWAVLAGTGSISGASDLFFRLNSKHELEMLLSLKDTSKHSRVGASQSMTVDSRIFVGDVDGDGIAEIIVEKDELETAPNKREFHSEKPILYKLTDSKYEPKGTIEKSQISIHEHAVVQLARSRFISIVVPGKAETKG